MVVLGWGGCLVNCVDVWFLLVCIIVSGFGVDVWNIGNLYF